MRSTEVGIVCEISMRLIFLNRYFYPDHSATSQLLGDLALSLAEQGHDVKVITSRQRYDDAKAALSAHERIKGVETHRVWSTCFGRANLTWRALDYLTFYVTAAWRLWRLARANDVIVTKTDPPLMAVIAAPIARLREARLVNWLQDVFPEIAATSGLGGRVGRLLLNFLRFPRDRSIRAAAVNIALGERMAERLRQCASGSRLAVISNWADGELIRPVPASANALRKAWKLEDKFVVGYSGNLGRVHELDAIVDAIAELSGANPRMPPHNIVFLFIGGGALYAKLQQEVAKRGFSHVQFKPYQPLDRLAESLSVPDVHLLSLRPEFEGLIVPSKLYGILAAGRPAIFIGDEGGEVAHALRAGQCGLIAASGDGKALSRHILTLAGDPLYREEMGQRARRLFEERFEKRIALNRWERLLFDITAQR